MESEDGIPHKDCEYAAFPSLTDESGQQSHLRMYTLKYCQLCLVVDVKTFAMNTATLEAYLKLLQLPLHNKEPYACYECSALLLKYQEFHAKCLRAHNVLTHFKMQSSQVITHEDFETQRKMYSLESNLSLTTILHDDIEVQDNYSSNKVLCNINSNENVGYPKINIVKDETKPYVYVERLVAFNHLTDYSVIEKTHDKKLIVRKEIQETMDLTSISELHASPSLSNTANNKQMVNTAKTVEPNNEIDTGEENSQFSDNPIDSDDEPLLYIETSKKLAQKTARSAKKIKSKNKTYMKDKSNESKDTSVNNLAEELLSAKRNSKKLVDQATEIAKSMLHEKYTSDIEENNTNENLENKLFQNVGNSEELVKKATETVHRLRNKRKNMDLSFYDGFARVEKLSPEEVRKDILLRKETSNYLESAYKCELCYRGFREENSYGNHMKKHSEVHGSFECEFCYGRYLTKRMMLRHINHIHTYKIFCTICPDYVTCSTSHAREHIRQHKGKKFPCDECDVIYGHQTTLLAHKRQMHAKAFVCDLCGSTYGTQRGLTCHRKLQHKQAATSEQETALCGPRCAECAVQFATEAAYARHRALSHQQAASQDCEFCGETFSEEPTLREHVFERHTQEQPRFCCAHCPFRFWDRAARKRHVSSQHPRDRAPRPREHPGSTRAEMDRRQKAKGKAQAKPAQTYICEYCGKDVNILHKQCHTLIHTGERPYKCKLCGKGFTQPAALYMHRATHATTRQYQCDKCPKNYKLKCALKRHIKTSHAGIRPHKCPICGKSFPFPCELRTHVKYTHEKVPWPTRVRKRKDIQSLQLEET